MRLTSTGAYARPQPVPKMPAGLVELMEDLTRNVLRHNPENVYEFCAAHMEKLLEIRDGRAPKPVLTLEQKITRVQEKMNKKAELRRQKYDKQMQLYLLNSKLEQRSEQQDDQMRHSNVVEDKSRNSSEANATQIDDKTKQSITAVPEDSQTLYSNTAENVSKVSGEISDEQEPSIKNNVEDFFSKSNEEEIKTEELENTDFGRVIDMKIESAAETKDSVEPDSDNQNKSEEPITKTMIEFKSVSDVVDFQPKNLTAVSPEQDIQISNDILHNKNDISAECESTISIDNDSDKNIRTKQTLTDELVAENLLKDETSIFDVPEDPKDSIEKPVEEVIETISKKNEFIKENVAQYQKAVTNVIDDECKVPVPVHHEKDLVNALEVEIFHEPREPNKGSRKETIDTQEFDAKSDNRTSFESDLKNKITKDEINEEGQYTEKKYSSFDDQDLPSTRKDGEKLPITTSSANFKSHSVDDHIKISEVNSFECTNKNITSSEIEVGNNIPKFTVSENSENISGSHFNPSNVESSIYDQSGATSGHKLNNGVAEVSVVDQEEVNNEENIITENVSPSADERVQEHLENIPKNSIPNTKEVVQDKSYSDTGVNEIPMQKKEYALLLPETISDNIIEPTTLKNTMHEETLSGELIENIYKFTETHNSKDENVETNNNESAAGFTKTDVAQTTDIKQVTDSSVGYGQEIKNIDNSQEKCINVLVDNIENKLIENAVGHIKQQNLDSHNEIIPEVKEQNNENKEQHNETISTNNEIKIGSETVNLEERTGDAEENMSYNSELNQITETPIANDSADESTIGDRNDSLMDQEVEITTRSKENMTPSIMDLETAAVTIQKVFRTFLYKSRCSTFEDTSTDEANPITDDDNEKEELEYPVTKERRPLGISRMDTVLQTVNEEKSLSLSTDDSSTLSSAATVIQAHVRGFLARNKFNSHKTASNASLVNSDGPSAQSFEADEQQKKTVLNIHIIPEGDHFLSRDESLITSMDLSLDGTPPSSVNLHPLGYDKSEPRKQLKREDAIQSVSPPSNNSGKLSEDVDSVKEIVINDLADTTNVSRADTEIDSDSSPTKSNTLETVVEIIRGVEEFSVSSEPEIGVQEADLQCKRPLTKMSSDEGDVVTPFEKNRRSSTDSDRTSCLLHSGEFHDIVLPTKVTRSDTSVVREFKNVLVYFLIWNT